MTLSYKINLIRENRVSKLFSRTVCSAVFIRFTLLTGFASAFLGILGFTADAVGSGTPTRARG